MDQTTAQRAFRHVRAAGTAGISPGDLQRKLGVSDRTVSRVIGELVAADRVVRPTTKGAVYATEYAPKATRPAPGKPRRARRRLPRDNGEVEFADVVRWLEKNKIVVGVIGLLGLFGILRPDRIGWHQGNWLANLATMGAQGRERAEKIIGLLSVEAVGRQADAFSPEELQAKLDKESRRLAENYEKRWNVRLHELEGQRKHLRSVIYEASDEEKAHYLVTMQVMVRIPVGQSGQPELGLRRVWYPGPAFPDEARRELAPPGSVITVEHFPRLLTIIAAELDERIRQHRVEPLPIQQPRALPEPPMTDDQRAKRIQQAQVAEAKRQKDVARVQAAYGQGADEEPGEQGPGVFVIR